MGGEPAHYGCRPVSTASEKGDVITLTPRRMTFAEAKEVLAGIGYRHDMTLNELVAATPADMLLTVETALTVAAEGYAAEAEELLAFGKARWPDVR